MPGVKHHIVNKILSSIRKGSSYLTQNQLISQIQIGSFGNGQSELQIKLPLCFKITGDREMESVCYHSLKLTDDEIIKDIVIKDVESNFKMLTMKVDQHKFIKEVLESDVKELSFLPIKKNVIVEFSSPNIAKPFHAGHLRSTIIGNFVSNLKIKLNQSVVKMNFLGDWGTQFGLLKYGVDKYLISDEQLSKDPIRLLYEAYVYANKESTKDTSIMEQAKKLFQKLENGDSDCVEDWDKYRRFTIDELKTTYSRLNITFDNYSWESQYERNNIQSVLDILESQGITNTNETSCVVTKYKDRVIPLIKSDGTTLYIMRDIAAVIDRQSKFNFDEMYYVVENGQSDHLNSLFSICERIHLRNVWNMKHVKFGRVSGMSTRQGSVVFLTDILDEAKRIMYEKQKETLTTKVDVTDEIADILGVSAVVINDLKQRRQSVYEFKWEKAVQTTGDTGIKLQYVHCRLYSILSHNSDVILPKECDPSVLCEPQAIALVHQIARYEEILYKADAELEPCILVNYLFQLCSTANRAVKRLTVKGQERHLASQRLLLFDKCRIVLADGMKILGIQPLNQM